mmetsp:Transcript_1948/g.4290  ORF Transcript_1948/g.4290 Transcript_1948/m.4290 type:complete len:130 (+) Transcript_1948:433-822(+)
MAALLLATTARTSTPHSFFVVFTSLVRALPLAVMGTATGLVMRERERLPKYVCNEWWMIASTTIGSSNIRSEMVTRLSTTNGGHFSRALSLCCAVCTTFEELLLLLAFYHSNASMATIGLIVLVDFMMQ